MSEEFDKSEKEKIKKRIVNIGDFLQESEKNNLEDNNESFKTEEQEEQKDQKKSWNERISRVFSRATAVGLKDQRKEEYITDTEEVTLILCEFFDADYNLPLLIREVKSGELTPKESIIYLGICMIGYLLIVRMGLIEKIGEKLRLREKRNEKRGDRKK